MGETPESIGDFNVFVGAETGLLKGVCINPKMNITKNFSNMHSLERKHEITAMSWGNEEQSEILLGLRGGNVRAFDLVDKSFTCNFEAQESPLSGRLVGVVRADDCLVTASEFGTVQVWRDPKVVFNSIDVELSLTQKKVKNNQFKDDEEKEKHLVQMKKEKSLLKMKLVPQSSKIVTGGKEHDLQIWDLNKSLSEPIFRAKNVPNDKLELRVPIWVSDFCFPDNTSSDSIAAVTRYGDIRLYDTRNEQRRPVLKLDWPEEVLTAISSTPSSHEILVGTATGHLALYDIRMDKKGMKKKFRGCSGGIRSIDCHPVHYYFAVVGLDRFLKLYDFNQPKPLQKMYLKSKLSHVLMSKTFDPANALDKMMKDNDSVAKKRKKEATDPDIIEVKGDGDEFWRKLPVIRSDSRKKGKKK